MNLFSGKKSAGFAFSFFIVVYLVAVFICQSILLIFFKQDSFCYQFICSLISPLVLFFTCLYFSSKRKEHFTGTINAKKFNRIYFFIAILIVVAMYFGLGLINYFVAELVIKLGFSVNNSTFDIGSPLKLIAFIISVAILPAICEEMFFRGLIFNSLKQKPIFAVLFSSLCFALYHASITQLIFQFIYGVMFALIVYRANSIIPSIIAHFINNFITLLFLYFNIDTYSFLSNVFVIIGGLLLLCFLLYYLIWIKRERNEKISDNESVKRVFILSSLGLFLSLLLLVLNMVA